MDETIEKDNKVRIIDLFVDSLKLSDFGFDMEFVDNARSAYHPADLLKLFIYGYLNKIRSSRDLEKESKRNIEVITSDPESRQMITRNNITEVAYNVQTTVDAKHCLPIDYKVTNNDDSKAMGDIVAIRRLSTRWLQV
ncbi:MAG: transposase [Methanolobus sp.]|nr:transposase [Methanolobus sp.]